MALTLGTALGHRMSTSGIASKISPFLYALLIAALAIAVIAFAVRGSWGEKEAATAGLTMFGTFLGALFAFRLNERKEQAKLEEEQRRALNAALFVIARQVNAIKTIKNDLAPYKTDFERGFNCPGFRYPAYSDLVLDFERLDFLMSGTPMLLMELSVQQEGFHQALAAITTRNDFYVDEVQPEISRLGLTRQPASINMLREKLGQRLTEGSINGAKAMYRLVDEAEAALPITHDALFKSAKALFPGSKFIKLAPSASTPAAGET